MCYGLLFVFLYALSIIIFFEESKYSIWTLLTNFPMDPDCSCGSSFYDEFDHFFLHDDDEEE